MRRQPEHQGIWTTEDQPDYPRLWGQDWWDGDEWYDLPAEEKWRMSVEALRTQAPEWSPDDWGRLFGEGKTGFDLAEHVFGE
jgi:hypothetical protein